MIQEKQKLSGTLNSKQSLNGSLSNSVIYVDPITQEKIVIPTTDKQIVTPDKNYDGLSKVTVNAITLQDKTITPTVEEQIVFPDDNYNGLNKVTVNAVTNEIDKNIISENIKNGVDILGITGNYVGSKYAPRYISFYNYSGTELNEEIANLDTSNITSMYAMFSTCRSLQTLDLSNFDTSKVTDMSTMFQYCYKLTTILGIISADNVKNINAMFDSCNHLTDFGGLKNLGQAYDISKSANYYAYKVDLSKSTKLTEQSLINVLTNLYDIKTKGCKAQQVILGSTNLAKLTSTEGQQALSNAQAKGWTVS